MQYQLLTKSLRFKLLCLAHDIMGQTNSLLTKKKKITRAAEPKPLNFKRKKKKEKKKKNRHY